ncbi:PREDICTED: uncharacterized protein LOC106793222 [Polistes canadensis]|uniref:uncharacterized protein LOC106793222 n=1 Tax=Polistes canadensis TaxID=91411 RepID=UPI000718B1FD|nr:PREDICTED: uncharacterized protein LOC106793222 [Polistes canadensis]XP_014615474.1 PREDICTED: uncharacterized protein LOC106793222 [Polistes canadensis]XP_014615475.1 PREDICTED: uncharacterized protein LOC106793222 [Polistes canadensis]
MIPGRILMSSFLWKQFKHRLQPKQLIAKQNKAVMLISPRLLSTYEVTKNIKFISQDNDLKILKYSVQSSNSLEKRPLLVLLCWLLAKEKHIMKFADLYLQQGFDVTLVTITPWQLMWPEKGSRLIAVDLLTFLLKNQDYQQIILHGFSVAGYMWGEALTYIHADREKYNNVVDRIIGHVWDSAADINEIVVGTPRAIFPNNPLLQSIIRKYLIYHMKAFYKQSTQYYLRSSQMFHTNLIRSPALIFVSNTDPVGLVSSNMRVRDSWDSLGTKTYIKIFDGSPHVGHYLKYPKEYVEELNAFLGMLNLIKDKDKITAQG